jgi:predicted nucleic acid-binding protein
MSDVIVDSNVVVKWILPEDDSRQAARLFTDVATRGNQLLAVDFALIEAANAIWKKYHRGLILLDDARRFTGDLLVTPLQLQPAGRLIASAAEIAAKYDRAVYDALFVALCRDLRLHGVTADEPLWRAMNADFPDIMLLRDWR